MCGKPQHTPPPFSGEARPEARKVSSSVTAAVGKVRSLACPGNLDGHRKATE